MGQSFNTYLECFSWILGVSLASYRGSKAQIQNRDIKTDLTHSSVHFSVCVMQNTSTNMEITSSSVVHWPVRKELHLLRLIFINMYWSPIDCRTQYELRAETSHWLA